VLINPDNAKSLLQAASLFLNAKDRLALGTVLRDFSEELIQRANAELEVQNQQEPRF
jgi:hypothetical protein